MSTTETLIKALQEAADKINGFDLNGETVDAVKAALESAKLAIKNFTDGPEAEDVQSGGAAAEATIAYRLAPGQVDGGTAIASQRDAMGNEGIFGAARDFYQFENAIAPFSAGSKVSSLSTSNMNTSLRDSMVPAQIGGKKQRKPYKARSTKRA